MTKTQEYAETILAVLRTPYPYGAAHQSQGPDDNDVTPERLHPAFYASLDWHSSCHMQWSAIRLLTEQRGALADDVAKELTAELDSRLTEAKLAREADYLRAHRSYERPYGWAWAAQLAAVAEGTAWGPATRPLAQVVSDHLRAWLPQLAYPVRHGVHTNTAFALALSHDAFSRLGDAEVVALIADRTQRWFGHDRDYPTAYEPSGSDFLSPALCEADLMRRVLPRAEFEPWLAGFLPQLAAEGDRLLDVPTVLDRTDGHAVHLYGLALSRSWQLRLLAPYLIDERAERARESADRQVAAVAPEISSGDFMSTHWLVSFALLADESR
ncbi:DUF2891 family protein [Flexivirga meconopsidis]|uniref:DUF2891 family protein n=1 Tax=Flexivirga meconopsidis TaxID=2977121 RepID=UPI0022403992|nr:DUF2891 family protein [Flexivirga meconopsidis]